MSTAISMLGNETISVDVLSLSDGRRFSVIRFGEDTVMLGGVDRENADRMRELGKSLLTAADSVEAGELVAQGQ